MPHMYTGQYAPKILLVSGTSDNPKFTVQSWYYNKEQGVCYGETNDYSIEDLRKYFPFLVPNEYQQVA